MGFAKNLSHLTLNLGSGVEKEQTTGFSAPSNTFNTSL